MQSAAIQIHTATKSAFQVWPTQFYYSMVIYMIDWHLDQVFLFVEDEQNALFLHSRVDLSDFETTEVVMQLESKLLIEKQNGSFQFLAI